MFSRMILHVVAKLHFTQHIDLGGRVEVVGAVR